METTSGVYLRESDKRQFVFEASYTQNSWTAKVRAVDGGYSATIGQSVVGRLSGDVLKEHVISWVEQCIRDRVGVE